MMGLYFQRQPCCRLQGGFTPLGSHHREVLSQAVTSRFDLWLLRDLCNSSESFKDSSRWVLEQRFNS